MEQKTYLVIDIGGTFTKFAIMNDEAEILEKGKVSTRQDSAENFAAMLEALYTQHNTVSGIAISSAGMIDSGQGIMHNGGSISCIQELPIAAILEEQCKVPVTIENDARSAGLAEIWKGSLADCDSGIAMILGTAVGGAVIINRKILKGFHGMAGEFSYALTDTADSFNPMKTLAMQGGVPALIRTASEKMCISKDELSGEIIFDKALQGNAAAIESIRSYARTLAVQITNYQFIVDPKRIAIGGGISAQPLLIDMIREELDKLNKVYPFAVPLPEIEACKYHNDSNLIGALFMHLNHGQNKI